MPWKIIFNIKYSQTYSHKITPMLRTLHELCLIKEADIVP